MSNEMKAKDLITGGHLHEGETPEGADRQNPQPPAGTTGGARERPPRPMHRGPRDPRQPGVPAGPPRMFAGPEESGLKDIMLLFLTEGVGNDYDGAIVRALIAGKDLDRGHLQHILDEGGRLQNLSESHVKILEKIHQQLQNMPG